MPATLPCQKIANTPPKIGTALPSTTVICLVRNFARAWATVRRMAEVIDASQSPVSFPRRRESRGQTHRVEPVALDSRLRGNDTVDDVCRSYQAAAVAPRRCH